MSRRLLQFGQRITTKLPNDGQKMIVRWKDLTSFQNWPENDKTDQRLTGT